MSEKSDEIADAITAWLNKLKAELEALGCTVTIDRPVETEHEDSEDRSAN